MSSWHQVHDDFFCAMKGQASIPFLKGFDLCGFDGGYLSPCAFF